MSLYKGIFWYVPDEKRLITVKAACDTDGIATEARTGIHHEEVWETLADSATTGKPFDYYPRGKVEIVNKQAVIYLPPALDRFDIHDLLLREFGLAGQPVVLCKVVADDTYGSYLADFPPTICNVCGKPFDCYDYAHNLCLNKSMGYGSNYDLMEIHLNMCCNCFDTLFEELLPRCKIKPISDWLSKEELNT